jgi:hypothetical protein
VKRAVTIEERSLRPRGMFGDDDRFGHQHSPALAPEEAQRGSIGFRVLIRGVEEDDVQARCRLAQAFQQGCRATVFQRVALRNLEALEVAAQRLDGSDVALCEPAERSAPAAASPTCTPVPGP